MIFSILSKTPAIKVLLPGDSFSSRNMSRGVKSFFLAGTIDNGDSENWQDTFIKSLSVGLPWGKDSVGYRTANVFNPRREDWDASWVCTMKNPEFYQQVNWEYDGMCKADFIVMNILPDSKSPVTLLELGMFADSGKILLICPDEFYRAGNVEFVCEKYDVQRFKDLGEIIKYLDNRI